MGCRIADARNPHLAGPGTQGPGLDVGQKRHHASLDGDSHRGWHSRPMGSDQGVRQGRRRGCLEYEGDLRPYLDGTRGTGQEGTGSLDAGRAKSQVFAITRKSRSGEALPEGHLLRQIDRHVDLSFVRERLKDSYSSTGHPSIDQEVLLRLLLLGYLYGIMSERRLLEEVRMNLAFRWFTRLDLDQEIPNHSTFSKNRHGRFRQSGVFREVFEEIVRRCLSVGLVDGRSLAVDGTLVGANASRESRIAREELKDAAQVSRTVEKYLSELEEVNPVGEADTVSTTDPDAAWAK